MGHIDQAVNAGRHLDCLKHPCKMDAHGSSGCLKQSEEVALVHLLQGVHAGAGPGGAGRPPGLHLRAGRGVRQVSGRTEST